MDYAKKLIGVVGVSFLVCLLVISIPSKAVSFDKSAGRLVYDDGVGKVFALPDGSAEPYGQAEVEPAAAKAKVKILSCHVTNPPIAWYFTFPWINIGESMAHFVLYEINKASDKVQLIFTITGPQFNTPYVYKTDWLGPSDPGKYYFQWTPGTAGGDGSDFYTTEGYYTMTVKGRPEGNKLNGASSGKTQFHISPALPAVP